MFEVVLSCYFQPLDQALVIQIILAFQRGLGPRDIIPAYQTKNTVLLGRRVFFGTNPISPGRLKLKNSDCGSLEAGGILLGWNFHHFGSMYFRISYWEKVDFHGHVSLPEGIQNIPRLLKMPRNP